MTKKLRVILVSIVAVLAILIGYTVYANKTPQEKSDNSLWTLVDRMDWLRTLKEECVNNLDIIDSAKFLKWESWYCDSRDAEIIELRNQISVESKKDYEGLR
jgi:hypothetical protein